MTTLTRTRSAVQLDSVTVVRRNRVVLNRIDLEVGLGEMVAIAGASGAGKTTLLKTVAGLLEPSSGTVQLSGGADPTSIGYVPQDDIIPLDLSVEQVLTSAAALRLAQDAPERRQRIDTVIDGLGLDHLRGSVVRTVSGGERKRVNVAVELLGVPDVFLLDEPTSGLDPASAATLLDHLRVLADSGTTVLMTTHAPSDIARSDRVVFLGRDGRVAYAGPPQSAPAHFGVASLEGVYRVLEQTQRAYVEAGEVYEERRPAPFHRSGRQGARPISFVSQLRTLASRNSAVLKRNRLSLAILLGSPILVTAMMLCLFPTRPVGSESGPMDAQMAYWLAFCAFFFGLTYGLLQIVPEIAILRRDRVAGVRLDAYVVAKLLVLTPVLAMATTLMTIVLLAFNRLPELSRDAVLRLVGTLSLTSVAGLAVGLLASAAVLDTTQATLALPMLCFPQVLFAGAVLPRAAMALPGRATSELLVTRWGFDGALEVLSDGRLAQGSGATLTACATLLVVITAVALAATVIVLRRRADPAR